MLKLKLLVARLLLKLGVKVPSFRNRFPEEREMALATFFIKNERKIIRNKKRFEPGVTVFNRRNLYYNDNSALLGMLHELFIKHNYKFETESKNPVIIDGGANIGLSVLYFKSLYPDCTITAVEPDPNIFSLLEKNVKSFSLSNVKLCNNAIWTNEDELIFQSDNSWGGYIGDANSLVQTHPYKVTGLDLNTLINTKVDFLKLDIEGAETEVLLHAKEKIAVHVDKLFFEWHSINGKNQRLGELLEYFGKNGFRYHIKEASTKNSPFIETRVNNRMDAQLDCFLYKL